MQEGFACANQLLHQLDAGGWVVTDNHVGKETGYGDPGPVQLHMVWDVLPCSKTTLEMALGHKIIIWLTGKTSGGH